MEGVLERLPRRGYPGFGTAPRDVLSASTDLPSHRQGYFTPLASTAVASRPAPKRTYDQAFDQRGAVNMAGRSYYTDGVPGILSRAMREGGGLPDDSYVDNTLSFESQPFINYSWFPHPWPDKQFEAYHFGQLVFSVMNKEARTRWDSNKVNLSMLPMLTIQGINLMLSLEKQVGDVLPGHPGYRSRTTVEIMKGYAPMGFVVVQGGGPDYRGPAEKGQEMVNIVNCCVYGNVRQVLKIWGNNMAPSTRLFLIIKRVPWKSYIAADDGFNIDPRGPDVKPDRSDPLLVENPFQVIPWCSPTDGRPPDSVLRYEDDAGRTQYGGFIEVGRVDSPEKMVTIRRELGTTWTSAKAAFNSGQMDVHVNIKRLVT